jgi:DHA1 family multidrug resistance protein-like MFS transporter
LIRRPTEPITRRPFLPREPWRRNQIAVTVAAGMVFLGFSLVMPFLPFYVRSLGVQGMAHVALWSGVLLTITPLLAALMGPVWGRLADRVGMKIMVTRVILAMTLHWALMYFATSIWQVLALRILLGLFSGFGTLSVSLVTHGSPRDRIGRAVGGLQATQILSTAVGPFFGGLLAQLIGIRQTFLLTFALCASAFLFVVILYREGTARRSEREAGDVVVPQEGPVTAGVRAVIARPGPTPSTARVSFRNILSLPMYLPLLPLLFLINMVDRSFSLSVPLSIASFAGEGGTVEATTGFVMSAGAFASAASAFILGRRSALLSPLRLLGWSLIGGVLAILPMALCREVLPFALLRVLLGLSVGGAATLAYTLGGDIIPESVRASGYSLLSSSAMLGGSMGPLACSLLTSIDLRATFVAGGLVYCVLVLVVYRLIGRAKRGAGTAPAVLRPDSTVGGA